MSYDPETPLTLYQVLEEEYESLHGQFPEEVTAYLSDPADDARPVEVKSGRSWDFRAGHLRAPKALASALLADAPARNKAHAPAGTASAGPHDQAKAKLCAYLRDKILGGDNAAGEKKRTQEAGKAQDEPKDILRAVRDFGGHNGASAEEFNSLVRTLEDRLNENVLTDPDLYGGERFTYDWLTAETRSLLSLREADAKFGDEEVKRLNRLLLEDAFPSIFQKVADVRLAAVYQLLHETEQGALCLSGGGIRSGTFALGLMQGLARHRLLEKFDYLSTVSGGGYTGGWLTAWIHRHPEGLAGVTRDLAHGDAEKVDPDPAAVRYLRRYSNFITPKVGLLTADTWTFVGIYLRNTFLNWLVFVPLIVSALIIPRLLIAITQAQPARDDLERWFSFPFPWRNAGGWYLAWPDYYSRHFLLTLGVLLGSWSLAYINFNRPGLRAKLEERRPFFRGKTGQGGFLMMCLLPLLVSAFCLTTYFGWAREAAEGREAAYWKFCVFGVLFTFVGWLIASIVLKRLKPRRVRETNLLELLGLIFVGVLGGTLFYSLAKQSILGSPVIGYDKSFDWKTTDWLAWSTEWYVCFAVPAFLAVFLLATIVFIGLTSTNRFRLIQDEEREWWARFGAWILISIIVWLAANLLVIFGPIALLALPALLAPLGGLSGLITLLVARSAKTPAGAAEQAGAGRLAGLMGSILPLLALVFIAFIVVGLSLATTGLMQALTLVAPWLGANYSWFNPEWLTNAPSFAEHKQLVYAGIPSEPAAQAAQLAHMNVLHHTWAWFVLAAGLALFGFGMALARVINLNIFSLHGGYRNRLIRAFLGASRPDHVRKPNPFTGFDPADNLHMHELRPALLDEGDFLDAGILAARLKAAMSPGRSRRGEAAEGGASDGSGEPDAASLYLVRKEKDNDRRRERLHNARAVLQDYAPDAPPSQRLIADLRADLNSLLKTDSLYKEDFAQTLLLDGRARAMADAIKRSQGLGESDDIGSVDRGKLRTDYHILLNRLVLEAAYPGVFKPSTYPTPPYKLMHVVNTTLNLVGGGNLAWQQRKAEPFSVSPLHSGCFRVGYRNSRDYGGRVTNGISLGTAATASGAAASSNMGYYTTSPVISLLLTLFNIRLGLWLGNPGPHGQKTYKLGSPTLSFKPVLSEAFGLTDDTNEYVYLTDGGHFENLAVYEMVLRRCHFIVVSDGAQDENFRFGDLGNAVRKIRIDLGVPIDFWDVPIYAKAPPPEQGKGTYWALARVRYSCVDKFWDEKQQRVVPAPDGFLLYIKPSVYGDEPRDVLEYRESFPAFPHQSTGDQFFDEPQFESYRMLGSHVMDRICGDGHDPLELHDMMRLAFAGLKDAKPDDLEPPYRLHREFIKWMDEWLAALKQERRAAQANRAQDAREATPAEQESERPGPAPVGEG